MTNFENITKDNIPIKLSCENCGTIAEFKTDEFEIIPCLNSGEKVKVTCPVCGEDIFVYIINTDI